MIISLQTEELKEYVKRQLAYFFPDKYQFVGNDVDKALVLALERTEYCFKHISRLPYTQNNVTYFSHLHSDQYSQFLYFLSNSLWQISENKVLCDKLINLNKVLNSSFYSYKCMLPDIFFLNHPVGTIIGNAYYSDFLVICQNVTINTGGCINGNPTPKIGRGVFLSSGAKIISDLPIGDYVVIGVDAVVYKREIASKNMVIRDNSGNIQVFPYHKENIAQSFFNIKI